MCWPQPRRLTWISSEDTNRGLANITRIWGVWLDIDGGRDATGSPAQAVPASAHGGVQFLEQGQLPRVHPYNGFHEHLRIPKRPSVPGAD